MSTDDSSTVEDRVLDFGLGELATPELQQYLKLDDDPGRRLHYRRPKGARETYEDELAANPRFKEAEKTGDGFVIVGARPNGAN